jgi:hypothetical protein
MILKPHPRVAFTFSARRGNPAWRAKPWPRVAARAYLHGNSRADYLLSASVTLELWSRNTPKRFPRETLFESRGRFISCGFYVGRKRTA